MPKVNKEVLKVEGEKLVDKVKELIKEGNVRRIILKNEEEKVLMEIPLTWGVVGVVVAPVIAAVGAVAALLSNITLEIERTDKGGADASTDTDESTEENN